MQPCMGVNVVFPINANILRIPNLLIAVAQMVRHSVNQKEPRHCSLAYAQCSLALLVAESL